MHLTISIGGGCFFVVLKNCTVVVFCIFTQIFFSWHFHWFAQHLHKSKPVVAYLFDLKIDLQLSTIHTKTYLVLSLYKGINNKWCSAFIKNQMPTMTSSFFRFFFIIFLLYVSTHTSFTLPLAGVKLQLIYQFSLPVFEWDIRVYCGNKYETINDEVWGIRWIKIHINTPMIQLSTPGSIYFLTLLSDTCRYLRWKLFHNEKLTYWEKRTYRGL